jgi:hypothetical protein
MVSVLRWISICSMDPDILGDAKGRLRTTSYSRFLVKCPAMKRA